MVDANSLGHTVLLRAQLEKELEFLLGKQASYFHL